MPGACDCEDEQVKDMKCCGCLPSYCWFKVTAWFQVILSIMVMIPLLLGLLFMGAVTAGAASADGATVTNNETGETYVADTDAATAAAGAATGIILLVFLLFLYSCVAACMFLCCDSAKARKLFAISLPLLPIGKLLLDQSPAEIVGVVLGLYWGYEMNKLSTAMAEGKTDDGYAAMM